jgi:hypothetical protein
MTGSGGAGGAGRAGRKAIAAGIRQVPFLAAYLLVGAALSLAALALHAVSRPLAGQLAGQLLPLYAAGGAVFFAGRAVLRAKLRRCRSCARWLALEPDGERVLRTRPAVRRSQTRLDAYNAYGQKTGYSRSRTVTRGIRETVAITMVCRHCGAKSVVKERREK